MITHRTRLFLAAVLSAPLRMGCAVTTKKSTSTTPFTSPAQSRFAASLTEQMKTEVAGEIYFAFDKSTIDRSAQGRLDRYASWMIDHPAAKFSVIGHADAVGSDHYNQKLGWKRAERVAAYLISKGVSHAQLHTTVSMGEDLLNIPTNERELLNRRVVIEIMEFLPTPVRYSDGPHGPVPVSPPEATNTPYTVCGGSFVSLCADAQVMALMDLEANAEVTKDLQASLDINGVLSPNTSGNIIGANAYSSVQGVVEATAGATSGTVQDTVDHVTDAVGGLL